MEESIGHVTESKGFEQLGVLVLDGSGSMKSIGETGKTRAEEVSQALRGLISRMKVSRLKANFLLGVITYDQVAKVRLEPTPVTMIDETANYDPLDGHGGETAIGDALEAANKMSEAFLSVQAKFPRSAVIVLMTDGNNNRGKDPLDVATSIKNSGKHVTICVAAYGKAKEVDSLMLTKLASDPRSYERVYDGEKLRAWFEASMSAAKDAPQK